MILYRVCDGHEKNLLAELLVVLKKDNRVLSLDRFTSRGLSFFLLGRHLLCCKKDEVDELLQTFCNCRFCTYSVKWYVQSSCMEMVGRVSGLVSPISCLFASILDEFVLFKASDLPYK